MVGVGEFYPDDSVCNGIFGDTIGDKRNGTKDNDSTSVAALT